MLLPNEFRDIPEVGNPNLERRIGDLACVGLSAQFPARLENLWDAMHFFSRPNLTGYDLEFNVSEGINPDFVEVTYEGQMLRVNVLALAAGSARLHIGRTERVVGGIPRPNHSQVGYLPLSTMREFFAEYGTLPQATVTPLLVGWKAGANGNNEVFEVPTVFDIPLDDLRSKADFLASGYADKPSPQENYIFRVGYQSPAASMAIKMGAMPDPNNEEQVFSVTSINVLDATPNLEHIMDGLALWLDKPYMSQRTAS